MVAAAAVVMLAGISFPFVVVIIESLQSTRMKASQPASKHTLLLLLLLPPPPLLGHMKQSLYTSTRRIPSPLHHMMVGGNKFSKYFGAQMKF